MIPPAQGPAKNNKSEGLVSTCLAILPPYSLSKSSTKVMVTTCGPLCRARAVNQLRGSEHAISTIGRAKSTLYNVTTVRVLIPGSETCTGARSTPPSCLTIASSIPGAKFVLYRNAIWNKTTTRNKLLMTGMQTTHKKLQPEQSFQSKVIDTF